MTALISDLFALQVFKTFKLSPNLPQTQGKIERWHQTLKNRILLENYFLPGDLEAHIEVVAEIRTSC